MSRRGFLGPDLTDSHLTDTESWSDTFTHWEKWTQWSRFFTPFAPLPPKQSTSVLFIQPNFTTGFTPVIVPKHKLNHEIISTSLTLNPKLLCASRSNCCCIRLRFNAVKCPDPFMTCRRLLGHLFQIVSWKYTALTKILIQLRSGDNIQTNQVWDDPIGPEFPSGGGMGSPLAWT